MKYSVEQRRQAISIYNKTKSVAETRVILGYPVAENTLYTIYMASRTERHRPHTSKQAWGSG